jgi:hypothetical protein
MTEPTQPGEQPEETVNPLQDGHESVTEQDEQYPSATELGDDGAGPDEDAPANGDDDDGRGAE